MPSADLEDGIDNDIEAPEPPTLSGPIIGIIYPPPEVRNIVDKTASFVARNGPEFEARIRQNELGNPKFNFLNAGDPYHAYYQHKVNEFRDGKVSSLPSTISDPGDKSSNKSTGQMMLDNDVMVDYDPPAMYDMASMIQKKSHKLNFKLQELAISYY